MKAVTLLILLAILAGDAIGVVEEQEISAGVLLGAVAFENGDSVVITVEKTPLPVLAVTYHGDGVFERRYSSVLPEQRPPNQVLVEACGGYLQIHAGWVGKSDPVVMKYRVALPGAGERAFLPLVCNGRRVLGVD